MEENSSQDQGANLGQENKVVVSGRVSTDYDSEPLNKIADAIRERRAGQENEENNDNILAGNALDEQRSGNRIARDANLISVFVFVATILVFVWNIKGINAAVKAANVAEDSYKETKRYNEEALRKQQETFEKNFDLAKEAAATSDSNSNKLFEFYKKSLEESNRFNRQTIEQSKKSLQVQIDAITKAQHNFEKENEPYLQIAKTILDTFEIGKPIVIRITIENLGKYAAKIKSLQLGMSMCKEPHRPDRIQAQLSGGDSSDLITRYIKDTPITRGIFYEPYSKSEDSLMSISKYTIYFWGYIKYTNLITENPRIYKFEITLEPKPGAKGEFTLNDNMPITQTEMDGVTPLQGWKD